MAWRRLNAEELAALDDLARVRRYIERQCEIPDMPQQFIEVSLDDYNGKSETIRRYTNALHNIAELWPLETSAKIASVSGINDGKSRAIIAEGAVTIARKALGIEKMP